MHRTSLALAALGLLVTGRAPAQRPETGAFVIWLGTDTIAVERFTHRVGGIDIEQVLRSPQTTLRHAHFTVTPAGELQRIEVMVHRIDAGMGAPLIASTTLTVSKDARDSAEVVMRRRDSTHTTRVAVPRDAIPAIGSSVLPYELAAMRYRAAHADSVTVTTVNAMGQPQPIGVKRISADSVRITTPDYFFRARLDRQGHILGLAAEPGTPFQAVMERVPSVDIDAIARAWQAKDQHGRAMGQLSPGDSVRATVVGARIAIDYSRPSRRGRVIFGGVVPWGQVWRAGANAATTFTTSRDLEMNGTVVPAGTYTIFTLPTPQGTTLIISKRTTDERGQPLWGTDYRDDMDLARIPMTTTTLASPVEQFTIRIDPQGDTGGVLRLDWDTREMSVPFRVREKGAGTRE